LSRADIRSFPRSHGVGQRVFTLDIPIDIPIDIESHHGSNANPLHGLPIGKGVDKSAQAQHTHSRVVFEIFLYASFTECP
jgi:hypothetical protein